MSEHHGNDGGSCESSHSGAVWAHAATAAAYNASAPAGVYTGPTGPAGGLDQPPSPNHAQQHGGGQQQMPRSGGGGAGHRGHNGGAAQVARQPAAIPEGGVGMSVGAGGAVNAWGSSGASGMEASATSQHGAISGAAPRVNPQTGQVVPPVRPSSEKRLAKLNHDDHTWCCQKLLPPQQHPAVAAAADGKTPAVASKLSGNEFGLYMASWSHIGARRHMEDRHRVVYRPPNDLPPPPTTLPNTTGGNGLVRGYCGVFDGHGGEEIAHHCGENLHVNIFECLREEYKRMASKAQAQAALHQANAQYTAAFNATYGGPQQPGGGSGQPQGSGNRDSPNHAAANANASTTLGGGSSTNAQQPGGLASTTMMMTNVSQTNLLPSTGQNTHANSSNNGQAGSNSVHATPPMGATPANPSGVPMVPLAGLSAPAGAMNPMVSPHSAAGVSQTASVTVLGQLMASNAAAALPSPGGAAPATQRDSETNAMAHIGQSKSDLNAALAASMQQQSSQLQQQPRNSGGGSSQRPLQGPADDSPMNARKPPSPAFGNMMTGGSGNNTNAASTPSNGQAGAAVNVQQTGGGSAPAMQHQGSLRTMKDRQRASMKGAGESQHQLKGVGSSGAAAGAGGGNTAAQGLVMGQAPVQQLSPGGHHQQQQPAAAAGYAYDTREPDAMSQSATSMSHSSYQPSGAPVQAAAAGQGVTQIRDEDMVKRAIRRGFEKTERHILEYSSRHGFRDGSTAVVIVVVGNTLYCANVGDSRAILCRNGKVVHLSEDHKPHNANERKRIEAAGGQVRAVMTEKAVCCCFGTMQVPKGALRLWPGGFSVSRTLGDIDYKVLRRGKIASTDILIAAPDILMLPLTPEDEFCVLGSDGLWDVISNDEAIEFVRSAKLKAPAGAFDPEGTAKKLVELAYTRGSEDNITAVVAFFTPLTAPSAAAYH